ncbi:GntR family transcriptional regulator [Bacillus sp. B15-48]|uniref:GntR family transcriptional regulator n=1 Tax=Bacillus sp. B15-48 TaxID=1548601 RepID=UPI00193F95D6|nr:GntR family transcriptional regulator [Bacillus sp. B15-48]MBM4761219.1 FCD domain-containing protein [Bacillus sp. B15-48]
MDNPKSQSRLVYRELIKNTIYDKIVSGELGPGARIIELEWAKEFNTSQAPVREALRDLESMGIIVSVPFKGAFVREMTIKDLKDIHSVRSGLETVALKNAILKATDKEIDEVKEILDKVKEYARKGEWQAFVDENIKFHQRIVELADTTELLKMWKLCNIKLWTIFNVRKSRAELIKLADSHDVIYEVLKNRQIERCYEVMDHHFVEVVDEISEEDHRTH